MNSLEKINQDWEKERLRWEKRSQTTVAKIKAAFTDRQIKYLRENYPAEADILEQLKFLNQFNKKNRRLKGSYPIITLTGLAALLEEK